MVNLDMSKYSIVTLDEVPSTNSYALDNLPFFDNGTVIFTTCQTSGRGRYNRKWMCDNSENIYMSVVLKPENISDFPFPNLTQYLSVVLCSVLENEFNLNPVIKWPNDILVEGAKISGILAESYMENNTVKGIVLGLGLNVNMEKETLGIIDQKATSLFDLTGKNYDCETIARKICDEFFKNYDRFVKEGFSFIKNEYIKRCFFLGKNIKISENGEKKEYFAQAIDDFGFLTVKDEFNNINKIITGDVLC
jgi:BirA family biotin operon repressor/biotin-[acetyl-CoA-carboxylase] ligase